MKLNTVYHESALITMDRMEDGLCNLIITSPPYADARKTTYGGVHPDKFIEWFKPFCEAFKRVLAKDGSLVINIGDVTVKGETHLFTFDLPIMMKRELGFAFIDPLIWHKKMCPPGRYPNRFKGAYEFCYHFSNQIDIKFNSDAVSQPANPESVKRALRQKATNINLSQTGSGFSSANDDMLRRIRNTGSNFSSKDAILEYKLMALPGNVLHISPETVNQNHPAVFPVELPIFFIKALTDEGDLVYDPFGGSGTTAEASARLNRQWILSEIKDSYIPVINKRIHPFINKIL
jgi:site-specific DNA-methyltransferase (adenine-specific)